MSFVTEVEFNEWLQSPVTIQLKKALHAEREEMKEGIMQDCYDNPDKVKGMCQAIANLLTVRYEDLYVAK